MRVKICGVRTRAALDAAAEGGAEWVGLVFHPPSPRHLALEEARALALAAPPGPRRVGLLVDPSDDEIAAVLERVPLDMLQLAGGESPGRAAEVERSRRLPVLKSVAADAPGGLELARAHSRAVSMVLLDASPPPGAPPGGNARPFDWGLLEGLEMPGPWMLAGGIDEDGLAGAAAAGARAVDVSSGVEESRGVKSPARIRALLARAASLP